jgi:linoleoyl-CoA desaturase
LSTAAVSFPNRDAETFLRELREKVEAHFVATGHGRYANWPMRIKTVLLLLTVFGSYAAIMSNALPLWAMLALAILMGIGTAGIGFGVAHDALHDAYSPNRRVNAALGLSFDLLGASSYLWRITHNIIHHTYTNIEGVDEDINFAPFLRFSPHGKYYWFHRFQHWYALIAYSVSTLFWVFVKDYKQLLQRDLGPYRNKRHPGRQVATLLAAKAFYYTWSIVLPLLVLHIAWWQFLIGFLALHLTAGLILGVVFQLAHVVEGTDFPIPDADGDMAAAWAVHELLTTSNFATKNRLLTWYVAGLNHQIEHHLFPRVCSVHYPAIRPLVQEAAAAHRLPYHEQPTLSSAVASHLRTLRRFGQHPAT